MKKRVQSSRSVRPWGFLVLRLSSKCFDEHPLLGIRLHPHPGSRPAPMRSISIAQGDSTRRKRDVVRPKIRWLAAFAIVVLIILTNWSFGQVQSEGSTHMKRRQQGILTGMPFMANLAPRTFVDDLGRKLYLAKSPKRIISLAPSITEILFALGLNEEIVGVTEFCDYPPEAIEKPKVGYSQPNLESIVALQPDLLLAPKSFLRVDILSKLEQLKIPTFVLEPHTVEDILAHIQMLGRMVGQSQAGQEQTASLRKQISTLAKQLEGLPRPTMLYVLNSEPLITVGPGSFIHHLIELAGGRNAAEEATIPYPRLTMEEVLRQNPEYLVFPVGRFEGIPQAQQEAWRRWDTLNAVKHNRLFQVNSDLLNRPGPRIFEGLKQLVNILHPEVLENIPVK